MLEPVGESSGDSASRSKSAQGESAADLSLDGNASRSAASICRFLIPAVLGLTADLWVKSWSFPQGVPLQGPGGRHPAEFGEPAWPVIPHVLSFQTTINHGAVFGIGQGMAFYFLLFSILAMAMILWVFLTSRASQWTVHVALGLITAGALGNLYDRAMFSGVRDMLRFYVHWYPYIFNLADVMLCIGVPLLMLRWLLIKEPEAKGSEQTKK